MLDYVILFILAFFGSSLGFFLSKFFNRKMDEASALTSRELYSLHKAFTNLSEDIRDCVFKSERKSTEFREQFLIYYKGIKDDLRSTLERLEKPQEQKNDEQKTP